jgi:hypothetical protein
MRVCVYGSMVSCGRDGEGHRRAINGGGQISSGVQPD